jgi:predicted GTPase
MEKASLVLSCGADFRLMGPKSTMLKSKKPVISVCAVRTGAGKTPTTRKICRILKEMGIKPVIIRHPMPYGSLKEQVCQRFAKIEDLKKHKTTIEEKEDYEGHIKNGFVVYAGVDYGRILREAEKEADIIVSDGGNNDTSFFKSDLLFVIADARRPGHEISYYPGETNLRMADIIIINKVKTSKPNDIKRIERNIERLNRKAMVLKADLKLIVDKPNLIKGKKVLAIDDGPTLTHGGLSYGAAYLVAKKLEAKKIIDPRPYVVGVIKRVYKKYPHIGPVLPALGYWKGEIKDLERSISNVPCDTVIIGTPTDLTRYIKIRKPIAKVSYEFEEVGKPMLKGILKKLLERLR